MISSHTLTLRQRLGRAVKAHWKKALVTTASYYAIKLSVNKYRINAMQVYYQNKASLIGDKPIEEGWKPTHYTVILDLKSGKKDGRSSYENHVAPIYDAAGIRTKYIEVRNKQRLIDKMPEIPLDTTDGIIYVGDDGSFQNFLTYLYRRPDAHTLRNLPIGLIPTGTRSPIHEGIFNKEIVNSYTRSDDYRIVENICQATYASVLGVTTDVDMLCATSNTGKSIYSLGYLGWGMLGELSKEIGDTFDSRFSRFRSQFKLWRHVMLDKMPNQYTATIGYKIPNYILDEHPDNAKETPNSDGWISQTVDFNSLALSNVSNLYGMKITGENCNETIQNGLLTLCICPPVKTSKLYNLWQAVFERPFKSLVSENELIDSGKCINVSEFTIAANKNQLMFETPDIDWTSIMDKQPQPIKTPFFSGKKNAIKDENSAGVELLDVPLVLDTYAFDSLSMHVEIIHKGQIMFGTDSKTLFEDKAIRQSMFESLYVSQ